jgi:phospholipase/carboxylesterase
MRLMKIGGLDVRIGGGDDGNGGGGGPLVVLLHGFGAPGADLVPLGHALRAPEGTRFVFPEAPIDLGPEYLGGRAWWWINLEERLRRQALGGERDVADVPDGLDAARAKVDALLGELEDGVPPAPGKMVLGGFSQGATLSLDVALRSARPLAGLILMSGTHIAARQWAMRLDARRGLPVLMSHGRDDQLLPFSVAEGLRDKLTESGLPVEWVPFGGGHGIPANVLDRASAFLRRVLA